MVEDRSALLKAQGLTRRFGGVVALSDYAIALREGELFGLIGPNGAGKTTAFNLLSGVLAPTEGSILLDGRPLAGKPPERFAAAGIARTFQNIRLFKDLTAWENVAVGYHMRHGPGWLATVFGIGAARRCEHELRDRAAARLAEVGLADSVDRRAGDLPYGHQRKLEIARALATEPRVLLLDEPAAGMNPTETAVLTRTIAHLHERLKLTVVLVEHDMRIVMALCSRIQVLNRGLLLAEGTPRDIQSNPEVVAAYLGTRRRAPRARAR